MEESYVSQDHEPSSGSVTSGQSPAFQCVVSADLVRRALLVATTEQTRFYLRGVHISPAPKGGAYVVGTDSHALAIFHDPEASITGEAILLPDERFSEALTPERGEAGKRLLLARKDRLFVTAEPRERAEALLDAPNNKVLAAQYRETSIDGTYPNWRKTFRPVDPAGVVPALDVQKLKRLARALAGDGSARPLTFKPTGPTHESPVWAIGSFANGVGVIMGMSAGGAVRSELPAWISGEMPAPPSSAEQVAGDSSRDTQNPSDLLIEHKRRAF